MESCGVYPARYEAPHCACGIFNSNCRAVWKGGQGHMFLPGMVTGVMQLGFGIYGYFGAEECDRRKAIPCI